MSSSGFVLSAENTFLVVFTGQITIRSDFSVRTDDMVIQPNKQAKFLGITFIQSLSWEPHIRSLITKTRRATSIVKLLKEPGVNPRAWCTLLVR